MNNKPILFAIASLILAPYLASIPSICFAQQAAPARSKNRTKQPQLTPQQILDQFPNIHFSKAIPVNFPIPPYPNNVVRKDFVNSKKGPPTAAVTIVTKDAPKVVYQWYLDSCKQHGWSCKVPTDKAMAATGKLDKLFMIDAQKDNQQVSIYCIADKKTSGTVIDINWRKVKA